VAYTTDAAYTADQSGSGYQYGGGRYAAGGSDRYAVEDDDFELSEDEHDSSGGGSGGTVRYAVSGSVRYAADDEHDSSGSDSGGTVRYAVGGSDRYPVRDDDFELSDDEFELSEDDADLAPAKHSRTLKIGDHYATESTLGSPDLPFIVAQGERLVGEGKVPSIHVYMQQYFGWSAGDVDKYIISKEASKVAYLDEDERKGYILNGGGAMTQGEDDEPFDTSAMFSKHSGKGFGIYVMAQDGTLYADQHKVGLFHHSSFLSGGDVAGAGEIKVIGGKVQCVTNKTGHYRAGDPELWQVLDELKSRGVNLAGVEARSDPRSTAPYPGGAVQFYEDHRP
jgi:hypothetical protein